MSTEVRDPIAEKVPCGRCSKPALMLIAKRCADCIAEFGLAEDQTEYREWRAAVTELVNRKP